VQCQELIRRVSQHCTAHSQSVLQLLSLPITAATATASTQYHSSSSIATHMHVHDNTRTKTLDAQQQQQQDTTTFHFLHRYVSTGMSTLDSKLRGGIPMGSITEIVGNAGVGKTQFAMQLCYQVATNLHQGSIYIDTERKMSLPRLQQLCHEQIMRMRTSSAGVSSSWNHSIIYNKEDDVEDIKNHNRHQLHVHTNTDEILANIVIHSPATMNELMLVINKLEEDIAFNMIDDEEEHNKGIHSTLQQQFQLHDHENHPCSSSSSSSSTATAFHRYPTRLVILDSIAALALREYGVDDAPQRVANLFHIVQTFKRLANQWNLAVVVINQVSGSSSSSIETTTTATTNNKSRHLLEDFNRINYRPVIHAALGSSWHHCVTTRLVLEYYPCPILMTNNSMNNDNHMIIIQGRKEHLQHDEPIRKRIDNDKKIQKVVCIRKITVTKSNIVPCSSMLFEIQSSGLHEWNI